MEVNTLPDPPAVERPCLLPRAIRQADAPRYLGMSRERFEQEVRPTLREVPIGARGVAFDRKELDAWFDQHIAAHGRPGKQPSRPAKEWP